MIYVYIYIFTYIGDRIVWDSTGYTYIMGYPWDNICEIYGIRSIIFLIIEHLEWIYPQAIGPSKVTHVKGMFMGVI